MTKSIKLCM